MKDIKVSIILPSYNVAGYIDETIKSALNQTLKNIEIICVDAGSEDGTLQIIEENAKSDNRIKLFHSDKKSYGYQVNLGIANASGEYIAILETDDYIEPDMYGKLYETAQKFKVDYVKADYDAFFTQTDGSYYFFSRHTFKTDEMYNRLICPKDYYLIGRDDWYLWQGIYSKEFLNKHNIGFSETPGAAYQDIGFLFWTGMYAESAVYLKDLMYHYRIDREGASSNLGKGLKFSHEEYRRITNKLEELDEKPDKKVYKMLYARMIKSFVSSYSGISEDENLARERKEIYQWFIEEIKKGKDKGYIDEDTPLQGHIDRLDRLMKSEEVYFQKYSAKKYLNYIKDKEEFAIFGCGDFGFKTYNSLRKQDKKICCFFDNNSELWGKKINGVEIKSPDESISIPSKVNIIISNEAYHDKIKAQLLEIGIEEDRLFVYQ